MSNRNSHTETTTWKYCNNSVTTAADTFMYLFGLKPSNNPIKMRTEIYNQYNLMVVN